ncbi:hypothetical protein CMUS01_06419 [Colletotrichum musicola]|uniref:Uncharacterized protein n=1 Tax=Colletotrichum musicola TaxID=2175873 RepID=A0A8H6KLN5_9PEZI|nr:hypothetical protein CMUS01_06419 [Colletotrichum musicola]
MPAIQLSHMARDVVLHLLNPRQQDSPNKAADDYMDKYVNGKDRLEDEYESGKKTVQVIGGGIIAVIVVVVVLVISSLVAGCCIYSRRQDQKRRRELEMKKYMGENRSSVGSSNQASNNTASGYGKGTYPGFGGYNNTQGYGYGNGYSSTKGNAGQTGAAASPPAYTASSGEAPTSHGASHA